MRRLLGESGGGERGARGLRNDTVRAAARARPAGVRKPDFARRQRRDRVGIMSATRKEGLLMKSPFPGMDPYLEACGLWEGFHGHLVEAIYRSIARVLPQGYAIDTA